jgi:hypothetical protein
MINHWKSGKKNRGKAFIGIAHIIIPKGISGENRAKFIEDSLRENKVSILVENGGGIAHDCPITSECLNNIDFPLGYGQLGSPVLFYLHPLSNMPIVFGTLTQDQDLNFITEGDRTLRGDFLPYNSFAEVIAKGKDGKVQINVYSDHDTGGEIFINASTKNQKGKLKINIIGESDIFTKDKCSITSKQEIFVKVTDPEEGEDFDDNVDDPEKFSSMKITPEKIVFNDAAKESYIPDINKLVDKINALEEDLNALKQAFNTWVPVVMDGGAVLKAATATWAAESFLPTEVDDIKDEKLEN